MRAALPPDEAERLATLLRYEILDTSPEISLDDLTLLASQICQTPFAFISFVDQNRQWFKSRIGATIDETPRDISFCAHAILVPHQVTEVRDLRTDLRFADNPLVSGEYRIRFYAGAPLIAPDGRALGTICVLDQEPRILTQAQLEALQALSRQVVNQLGIRQQAFELAQVIATRERVQHQLHEQFNRLEASQRETKQLLELAEKSRQALLSVLEDEKRSGQYLRESEERFRQVVENIHEVLFLSDLDRGHFIYISPGYEQVWARPATELYTNPNIWLESVHPDDRTRVRQAAKTDQVSCKFDETYRMLRPDGTTRWIRDRAFPVRDPDGTVKRVVGVAEDITERKTLEEQFLHAQRMEAVGALASGVAHDLNNILAPMLMIAGMLKENAAMAKERDMLGMIESSGMRGAGIIRQLLAFSRGIPGERVTLQPKHLVRDMVQIMRETFPRNIKIVELLASDVTTVQADATQLHQVLMNLCVNARDAMPDGGTLTLEAVNQEILEESPSEPDLKRGFYVVLRVKDTGTGIPPEIIGRIFEPFYTTKAVGQGTGLGLSTVVGIMKSHGGTLRVQSKTGEGTTFEIFLRRSEEFLLAEKVGVVESMSRGHGELILVVDDEAMILNATQGFLEEHGYRVTVADSGEDAMKVFLDRQLEIRLVLTDIMMPGIGGLALIRALRNLAPKVKILATSGLDQDENSAEFKRLGVFKTLAKPFPPNLLLEVIRDALASSV